jgi:hypothetical protein
MLSSPRRQSYDDRRARHSDSHARLTLPRLKAVKNKMAPALRGGAKLGDHPLNGPSVLRYRVKFEAVKSPGWKPPTGAQSTSHRTVVGCPTRHSIRSTAKSNPPRAILPSTARRKVRTAPRPHKTTATPIAISPALKIIPPAISLECLHQVYSQNAAAGAFGPLAENDRKNDARISGQ